MVEVGWETRRWVAQDFGNGPAVVCRGGEDGGEGDCPSSVHKLLVCGHCMQRHNRQRRGGVDLSHWTSVSVVFVAGIEFVGGILVQSENTYTVVTGNSMDKHKMR